MRKTILGCLILGVFCLSAFAQGAREQAEARLMQAFQGKNVVVLLDMPATNKGVDVVAGSSIDREKYQKRLKTYGTAIMNGRTAAITAIKVTKDEIVLELAGGGAAEIDPVKLAGPEPGVTASSSRENHARSQVNRTDPAAGTYGNANSTLRYEASKRNQEDALKLSEYRARRDLAVQKARREALQKGSRFVVKFDRLDTAAVTPDELKRALADYVQF